MRSPLRMRRNRASFTENHPICAVCGYDLSNSPQSLCPECGATHAQATAHRWKVLFLPVVAAYVPPLIIFMTVWMAPESWRGFLKPSQSLPGAGATDAHHLIVGYWVFGAIHLAYLFGLAAWFLLAWNKPAHKSFQREPRAKKLPLEIGMTVSLLAAMYLMYAALGTAWEFAFK